MRAYFFLIMKKGAKIQYYLIRRHQIEVGMVFMYYQLVLLNIFGDQEFCQVVIISLILKNKLIQQFWSKTGFIGL